MDDPEYFECECSHPGHVLRFIYDEENNEIYTEVQLSSGGIFKRIWNALKYVFKGEVGYGVWDCTMIRKKDVPRLINLLEKVRGHEVPDRAN